MAEEVVENPVLPFYKNIKGTLSSGRGIVLQGFAPKDGREFRLQLQNAPECPSRVFLGMQVTMDGAPQGRHSLLKLDKEFCIIIASLSGALAVVVNGQPYARIKRPRTTDMMSHIVVLGDMKIHDVSFVCRIRDYIPEATLKALIPRLPPAESKPKEKCEEHSHIPLREYTKTVTLRKQKRDASTSSSQELQGEKSDKGVGPEKSSSIDKEVDTSNCPPPGDPMYSDDGTSRDDRGGNKKKGSDDVDFNPCRYLEQWRSAKESSIKSSAQSSQVSISSISERISYLQDVKIESLQPSVTKKNVQQAAIKIAQGKDGLSASEKASSGLLETSGKLLDQKVSTKFLKRSIEDIQNAKKGDESIKAEAKGAKKAKDGTASTKSTKTAKGQAPVELESDESKASKKSADEAPAKSVKGKATAKSVKTGKLSTKGPRKSASKISKDESKATVSTDTAKEPEPVKDTEGAKLSKNGKAKGSSKVMKDASNASTKSTPTAGEPSKEMEKSEQDIPKKGKIAKGTKSTKEQSKGRSGSRSEKGDSEKKSKKGGKVGRSSVERKAKAAKSAKGIESVKETSDGKVKESTKKSTKSAKTGKPTNSEAVHTIPSGIVEPKAAGSSTYMNAKEDDTLKDLREKTGYGDPLQEHINRPIQALGELIGGSAAGMVLPNMIDKKVPHLHCNTSQPFSNDSPQKEDSYKGADDHIEHFMTFADYSESTTKQILGRTQDGGGITSKNQNAVHTGITIPSWQAAGSVCANELEDKYEVREDLVPYRNLSMKHQEVTTDVKIRTAVIEAQGLSLDHELKRNRDIEIDPKLQSSQPRGDRMTFIQRNEQEFGAFAKVQTPTGDRISFKNDARRSFEAILKETQQDDDLTDLEAINLLETQHLSIEPQKPRELLPIPPRRSRSPSPAICLGFELTPCDPEPLSQDRYHRQRHRSQPQFRQVTRSRSPPIERRRSVPRTGAYPSRDLAFGNSRSMQNVFGSCPKLNVWASLGQNVAPDICVCYPYKAPRVTASSQSAFGTNRRRISDRRRTDSISNSRGAIHQAERRDSWLHRRSSRPMSAQLFLSEIEDEYESIQRRSQRLPHLASKTVPYPAGFAPRDAFPQGSRRTAMAEFCGYAQHLVHDDDDTLAETYEGRNRSDQTRRTSGAQRYGDPRFEGRTRPDTITSGKDVYDLDAELLAQNPTAVGKIPSTISCGAALFDYFEETSEMLRHHEEQLAEISRQRSLCAANNELHSDTLHLTKEDNPRNYKSHAQSTLRR